ncbi:MAG: SBBP repeat-containing protein [Bacteroidia bacterium]|nr:SBBP repeat-containing protein [Bacteroidia bacterium]
MKRIVPDSGKFLVQWLLLAVFFCNSGLQGQTLDWARRMGGGDTQEAFGVAVDGAGNVFSTGSFRATADFDPGPGTFNMTAATSSDIYVSKLDASGAFVWAKQLGYGPSICSAYDIVTDGGGNSYIAGVFQGTGDMDPGPGVLNFGPTAYKDGLVVKLDPNGNLIWARALIGTNRCEGHRICLDPSGNVLVTGWFEGTVDFDPGPGNNSIASVGGHNTFVLKLSSNGNFIWARNFAGANWNEGYGIEADAAGHVYITGHYFVSADFDPGPGTFTLTSAGSNDVFVTHLDAGGNFVAAVSFGGTMKEEANGLSLDPAGNILVTGIFRGTTDLDPGPGVFPHLSQGSDDVFLVKLDNGGNFVWGLGFGANYVDVAEGVATDILGNAYITGYFNDSVDFDPGPGNFFLNGYGVHNMFIARYDPLGNLLWAGMMGTSFETVGRAIAVNANGNIYASGRFTSTGDFDPGPGGVYMTSAGGLDAFVLKFNPDVSLASGHFDLEAEYDPSTRRVDLQWKNPFPTTEPGFGVQWSADGENWMDLGHGVRSFADEREIQGLNFYRLKAILSTGEMVYSEVETISIQTSLEPALLAFPNPSLRLLTLAGESLNWDKIKITDLHGRDVKGLVKPISLLENSVQLDISGLTQGCFLIHQGERVVRIQKF